MTAKELFEEMNRDDLNKACALGTNVVWGETQSGLRWHASLNVYGFAKLWVDGYCKGVYSSAEGLRGKVFGLEMQKRCDSRPGAHP